MQTRQNGSFQKFLKISINLPLFLLFFSKFTKIFLEKFRPFSTDSWRVKSRKPQFPIPNLNFIQLCGDLFWPPQNLGWNSTQNVFEHYLRNFYPFLTLISYICCILILLKGYFQIEVVQLHFVYFPEAFQK